VRRVRRAPYPRRPRGRRSPDGASGRRLGRPALPPGLVPRLRSRTRDRRPPKANALPTPCDAIGSPEGYPEKPPARWTATSGDSFGSAATEDRGERLMESDLELHAAESYASVSLKQETRQSKRELMRWSSPSAMQQANGA
jgi:hypothetical protein